MSDAKTSNQRFTRLTWGDTIDRTDVAEMYLLEAEVMPEIEQLRDALRKVCEHSARGSVVYQIAAGALVDSPAETSREPAGNARSIQLDAARYRWLREQQYNEDVDLRFMDHNEDGPTDVWYSRWNDELDTEIDEQRSAEKTSPDPGRDPAG